MKNITKLKFVIISISTIIGISTIITICAYSSISANGSQLALYIENLVLNFWICRNGTVSTSLARFFFPDIATICRACLLMTHMSHMLAYAYLVYVYSFRK